MILQILPFTNQVMNEQTQEILITKKIKKLAKDMIETMDAVGGIGLAANQVGYPYRMFVMATTQGPLVAINPIIYHGDKSYTLEEGCLSAPGFKRKMNRRWNVTLWHEDIETGGLVYRLLQGIEAACAQHEMDHLNGVSIVTKVIDVL